MLLPRLSHLLSLPCVRALVLSALLWLLVFLYCDQALWRDPHAAYFHLEHIYDPAYSLIRQQEARAFLANASTASATETTSDSPVLCAAFATIGRNHPDAALYFSDGVGSMLEGLTPRERAALHVRILFADVPDPAKHPDYDAPWLGVVDHAAGYEGFSEEEMQAVTRMMDEKDWLAKGMLDYRYALEQCYKETTAPFIAVFEDDVIFAADWMARTLRGLQGLDTASVGVDGEEMDAPWLYLRLFYTETARFWDAEFDWWYGHLLITFGMVAFNCAIGLFLVRYLLHWRSRGEGHKRSSGRLGLRLDAATIAVLSAVVAPAFTALVFMAGKYNLPMYAPFGSMKTLGDMLLNRPAWQRGSGVVPMETQGCCTQALVFDRARVPGLVDYLRERGRGAADWVVEDYAGETHLKRFALGEQVVQHQGLVSSRGGGKSNSIWAFYFEQSDAEKIRDRHELVLGEVDWDLLEAL